MKDTLAPSCNQPAPGRKVRDYSLTSPPAPDTVTIAKCGPNAVRVPKKRKGLSPIRNAPKGRSGAGCKGWTKNSRRSVQTYAGYHGHTFCCFVTLNYPRIPSCDELKAHKRDLARWLKRHWRDAGCLGVIEFKVRSDKRAGFPHFHVAVDRAPDDDTGAALIAWWERKTGGEGMVDARPDTDPERIAKYISKSGGQKSNPDWWSSRCAPWFTNLKKPEATEPVEMPREVAIAAGLMSHSLTHNGADILDSLRNGRLSQSGTIEGGAPNRDNSPVPNRDNSPLPYRWRSPEELRPMACPTCWNRFVQYVPKLGRDTCPKCGTIHTPGQVDVSGDESPITVTFHEETDSADTLDEIKKAVLMHPGTHPLMISIIRAYGGETLYACPHLVSRDLMTVPIIKEHLRGAA